jgi:hypothetical protein
MIQQAPGRAHRSAADGNVSMGRQKPRRLSLATVVPLAALAIASCSGEIYVRDGVTDGDTFYLAQSAITESDPALQSWVSYSLTRSACQLQIGGDNPARATSFECELTARRHLIDTWSEYRARNPEIRDRYLDEVTEVRKAGFLPEYVADNFRRRGWDVPPNLDQRRFRKWQRVHLPGHKAATRIIGSWNYARNVNQAQP